MTSIEQRLQDLGGAVAPPPLPTAGAVMRRGRQRRARRRGAGLAVLALAGTGGVLAVRAVNADDGTRPIRTSGRSTTTDDPATRAVPDVRGMTVQEARPLIERLGLAVSAPSGSDLGEIVAQDPAPGTPLHVGRPVTLQVADLDRPRNVDGPVIRGQLLDGRTWTVGDSSRHGLCATLGSTDVGCDDIGPVIAPGADPATPRAAADATGSNYPGEEACSLVYAFLPPGAENVELAHDDGRTVTDGLVVEPTRRFWAMPVQPGDNPETVIYRDATGAEIARFPERG
jgi:PASTA domain-containing protein